VNIGVYDVNTNQIVNHWNGVSDIERKDLEVHFLHEGVPKSFYARQDNYLIVDSSITLYEGMEVTAELLNQDQKERLFKTVIEQMRDELRIMQETINFTLGL
jgi:hypothetical protein